MITNLFLWIIYFTQTCLASCSNFMSEEQGVCESINAFVTRGQCCVCDPEDQDPSNRFCACSRAFRSSKPIFCFGHANDHEYMSKKQYEASRIAIIFKVTLAIYALVFGIIGIWCLASPESVVFNHVVVDEFRQQLGLQVAPAEEKIHKDTVMNMLTSSLSGLSSLFEKSDEISKEDLARIRDQLNQVENNLIYTKPEAVSMTEPTSLEGGSMLFYAGLCIYQLMMTIPALVQVSSVYVHWIWFGCKIIAIISAASGHGRGLENSGFVTTLIVFYSIGMVVYAFIERWIHSFNSKHGPLSKEDLSDNEEESTSHK